MHSVSHPISPICIHFCPFFSTEIVIHLQGSVLITTYPMLTWPADPLGGWWGGAACVESQRQFSLFQDFGGIRHNWTGSWVNPQVSLSLRNFIKAFPLQVYNWENDCKVSVQKAAGIWIFRKRLLGKKGREMLCYQEGDQCWAKHCQTRNCGPTKSQPLQLYQVRGVFCLVLEYADRGTLKDAMRRAGPNPWTETDVWMFITQMSRALNHLHSMSPPILHRDLKPDNILGVNKPVGPGGGRQMFSWKLADFGVAKILTREAQTAYYEADNPGVATYMAPEVLRHYKNYTGASDMWSLGCVIAFVMNKGRPLFECKGDVLRYSGNYFVKEFAAVLRGVFYRLLRVCSSIWGKIYLFKKPFFIP